MALEQGWLSQVVEGLPKEHEILESGALHEAMSRAGHLLATRPRTESEMRQRLGAAGFESDVVARTLARLAELNLIDDAAFARQWVDERSTRKGLAADALRAELRAKGVGEDEIDAALEAVDEAGIAWEVALKHLRRVEGRPLQEQAAKLTQAIVRRGFSYEVAAEAVRSVLPPEGWD